jgi:Cof subfamily protein (haloacid dehalogenase superfamily)
MTPRPKLYVSDLDGTLLRSDGALSDFSRQHLVRLLEEGLAFTVASARAVSSVQAVLPGLPLTLPVIAGNGAVLADLRTGQRVAVHALDAPLLRAVYAFVGERGHVPFLAGLDGAGERLFYSRLANEGMERYVALKQSKQDRRLAAVSDLADCLDQPILAIALCDHRAALEDLAAAVADRFGPAVAANFFEDGYAPGWFWLALQNPQAQKDRAVAELAARLGFGLADLVVFGDHWNDLPMFRLAGTSIAVANATEELKAHASLVIGPNEEDSVVKYLIQEQSGSGAR